MTRTTNFIIAIILSISGIYSQQKFEQGYVIRNSKDTLFGWIDTGSDILNTKECSFKTSKNSEIQKFQPSEILGYRLSKGSYFISKAISYADTSRVIFLEYLTSGKISLYHYKDESSESHYLIEKQNNPLSEISIPYELTQIGGKYYSNPINIDRDILKYYLQECPELFPEVDKMFSCKSKVLVALLSDYNACSSSNEPFVSYLKTKKQFPFEFEGFGGIKNDLKSFNNKAVALVAGINVYYLLPILTKKSKVYLKSGYTIHHYNSVELTFEETDPIYRAFNGPYYTRSFPSYNLFSIPIQLQVQFTDTKFSPIVSLGVNLYKDYFIPCINLGCKYSLTKNLSAVMAIDLETYTPMISPAADDSESKGLASYSLNLGLRYRF